MTEDMSDQFQFYRLRQTAEARPYKPGEALEGISIGEVDRADGSPKEGDMIVRNHANHEDQWLVSAAYFTAHYEREPIG